LDMIDATLLLPFQKEEGGGKTIITVVMLAICTIIFLVVCAGVPKPGLPGTGAATGVAKKTLTEARVEML